MRTYSVTFGGGIESLTLGERATPVPGPDEVLLRVCATSLSYRELMVLRGRYPLPVKPELVPISDGAGDVTAIGERVTRVGVGDRVVASVFPRWLAGRFSGDVADQLGGSLDGLLTEYALVHQSALVRVPSHLSFEQAATLPCAAVTAWNALTGGRGLAAGETVVTLGSGGVSLFALQLAKASGARVIATAGGAKRAQRLRELGADEVIDYRASPVWSSRVRELTGGAGAEHVVDVVGNLEQSVSAVAVEGEVALVGLLAAGSNLPTLHPELLFVSGAAVRAIAVGSRAQLEAMSLAIERNQLTPVIDRVFTFSEAEAAYRYYEHAKPFGKVVIAHPRRGVAADHHPENHNRHAKERARLQGS